MDPGDVLADRYEVERLIGRGGMGQVLRARDRVLGRHVALKVLAGELLDDDRSIERILTEARLAAKVRHPNVVQVLDAIVDDEHPPVIVLEHVDGPTLAQVVRERAPLPVEEAVDLLGEVAAGLAAAHAAGLVHRDVSPSNILLDAGTARLTDFGIARSTDAERTLTGTIRGSVAYVAPEQATGTSVSPATDVYALACVGFALLTGRPPFEAEEPLGVVHQHVATLPPDVREVRPDVPVELAVALQAAMAKDPARRIPDAAAFAAAVGRPLPDDDTEVVVLPRDAEGTGGSSLETVAIHEVLPPQPDGDPGAVDRPAGPSPGRGAGGPGPVVVVGATVGHDRSAAPDHDRSGDGRRRITLPWVAAAIVLAVLSGLLVGQLLPTPVTIAAPRGPAPGPSALDEAATDRIEDRLLAVRGALVELQTVDDVAPERGAAVDEVLDRSLAAVLDGDLAALRAELSSLRDLVHEGVATGEVTPAAEVALLEAVLVVRQEIDDAGGGAAGR